MKERMTKQQLREKLWRRIDAANLPVRREEYWTNLSEKARTKEQLRELLAESSEELLA